MSFLQYSGKFEKIEENYEDSYIFFMNEGKNLIDNTYIEVTSPIIDNTFQKIFGENEQITKSLLNSLIYPEKERINKIEFLPTNRPGKIGEKNSFYSIRTDVLCKCYLDFDNEDEDKELIVDLEMQINFNKENTKRFIYYLKRLYSKYFDAKIIVLALVFRNVPNPYINKGTKTNLEEKDIYSNLEVNHYDEEFTIYQIDISYCYKLLLKEKKLRVIKKEIDDIGKEWLKFLNLPNWCSSIKKNYYVLPPLRMKFFKSKEVFLAFKILKDEDNIQYDMYLYDLEKINQKNEFVNNLIIQNKELKEMIKNLKEENEELKKSKKK